MSTQHQSVFVSGIVVEGIFQYLLHQYGIACLHIVGADAHIVERQGVSYLTITDTCQPGLLSTFVATYEGQ